MREIEKQIKETVKKLFADNKFDVFIGYTRGTLPLKSTPCFITKPDDIEKLVWNSFCANNLAVYLTRFFAPQPKKKEPIELPRVGIFAKGCDVGSIVGLIKEHQIPRDNIFIYGVICEGMVDRKKIPMSTDIEIVDALDKDGKIIIIDENKKEAGYKKEELLFDSCLDCIYTRPSVHDILIGTEPDNKRSELTTSIVEDFEKKSLDERWKYFQEQISKCIRCYACRQVCPNCYCKECFAEQTRPKWIGPTNNISDIMFYQIGRIFHMAGRCIDCGACGHACPMGIDLRTFTYKLVKDVKELFDYEAGLSFEDLPPLATFKPEDKQEYITEP